ncbi:MAG: methylmalonyl Co-A mutase-associated GTPase MeaB [Bacteroidales bacterium]|nr:methylmalonyl Co-A mutase-associated GTPase MeaB [Bacteroidales bacterium]MBN2699008.1 methylmalonyl Co-A mutase-associated GTPase MeaB [Bacteroidales bacterium]
MPGPQKNKKRSALSVSRGVARQEPVNREALERFKKASRKHYSWTEILEGIRAGDTGMLSRGITLIESAHPGHREEADNLVSAALPLSGNAFRIGITGVPGAGKSTFIESLGMHITSQGKKLAVLAIDPSSERSKGSILGDKTRMENLANNPNAFIRPSPTGGTLGGVARKTRESIILCEAAGFDTVFVETVGVGQSETAVHRMVDFFLLIMLAGAGDELQGIKRGIMEMADAITINKADGTNIRKASRAQAEYAGALHLFPPHPSGWNPRVLTCSSLNGNGIGDIWDMIRDYRQLTESNGYLLLKRRDQSKYWFYETIKEGIFNRIFSNKSLQNRLKAFEEEIIQGRITPFQAAMKILSESGRDV